MMHCTFPTARYNLLCHTVIPGSCCTAALCKPQALSPLCSALPIRARCQISSRFAQLHGACHRTSSGQQRLVHKLPHHNRNSCFFYSLYFCFLPTEHNRTTTTTHSLSRAQDGLTDGLIKAQCQMGINHIARLPPKLARTLRTTPAITWRPPAASHSISPHLMALDTSIAQQQLPLSEQHQSTCQ